jgi:integrase
LILSTNGSERTTCIGHTFCASLNGLYYPGIQADKRPKPDVIENIPKLKRKEQSVYKPTDLWTQENDLLFLRYCPSKRMKCYHAMSRDTGCRPHELLKLRICNIVFKSAGDTQYAEVLVNGKTGSRHIPLINSLPYIKDYLDQEHPQPNNYNAPIFAAERKSLGRAIQLSSLYSLYDTYKKELFPKLLRDSENVVDEDKQKIKALLRKPWNPYIRSALNPWNITATKVMVDSAVAVTELQ